MFYIQSQFMETGYRHINKQEQAHESEQREKRTSQHLMKKITKMLNDLEGLERSSPSVLPAPLELSW